MNLEKTSKRTSKILMNAIHQLGENSYIISTCT